LRAVSSSCSRRAAFGIFLVAGLSTTAPLVQPKAAFHA
jgi:hypothetical protein